jgi:hypothetical protein
MSVIARFHQQCRYEQCRVLAVLKLQHPSTQVVEGRCFRYDRRQVFKNVVDRDANKIKDLLEPPIFRGETQLSARFLPCLWQHRDHLPPRLALRRCHCLGVDVIVIRTEP